MTARILRLGVRWVNRKLRARKDDSNHELKTLQKELENSINGVPKPKPKRRRFRKHLVDGRQDTIDNFKAIAWSDFESTTKWATTVRRGGVPGLLSRKNAANVNKHKN